MSGVVDLATGQQCPDPPRMGDNEQRLRTSVARRCRGQELLDARPQCSLRFTAPRGVADEVGFPRRDVPRVDLAPRPTVPQAEIQLDKPLV